MSQLTSDHLAKAGADNTGLGEGSWVGGWTVGKGGNGVVNVWVKLDDTGRVTERIAIKDVWSAHPAQDTWKYRGIYEELYNKGLDLGVAASKIPGQATVEERFFKEAYIQGMLTPSQGESNTSTVPMLGYTKRHLPGMGNHWRIFMDYLAYGDLHNIIYDYRSVGQYIPHAFVHWTFWNLAHAAFSMEFRARSRAASRLDGDEVIVAYDMKPANVMLDYPREHFMMYPRPVVGDFGGAELTYPDDPDQKEFPARCTPGYTPPEAKALVNQPVASWTNVWQIGRIIEHMIDPRFIQGVDLDYYFVGPGRSAGQSTLDINPPPGALDVYPAYLLNLVARCQRFNAGERPTPAQIIHELSSNANDDVMRASKWGSDAWIQEKKMEKAARGEPVEVPEDYQEPDPDQPRDLPHGFEFVHYGYPDKVRDVYAIDENPDQHWLLRGKFNDEWLLGRQMYDENGDLKIPLQYRLRADGEAVSLGPSPPAVPDWDFALDPELAGVGYEEAGYGEAGYEEAPSAAPEKRKATEEADDGPAKKKKKERVTTPELLRPIVSFLERTRKAEAEEKAAEEAAAAGREWWPATTRGWAPPSRSGSKRK